MILQKDSRSKLIHSLGKWTFALVISLACILLVGCETNKTEVVDNMMTERQVEILNLLGLPTDWEKLTLRQKDAITAIEEMMNYAEEKYDEEFIFVNYEEKTVNHIEMTTLCPTSGTVGLDSFAVWREFDNGKECFKDEYYVSRGRRTIEGIIKNEIVNNTQFKDVKAFVVVITASEEGLNEKEFESIDALISGVVFIKTEAISDEDLNEVTGICSTLLDKSRITGSLQIIVVSQEVFKEVSEINYLSTINNENYIRRESIRF